MNETTTVSLATMTNASLVEPTIILALAETPGLIGYCREFDYRTKPTSSVKLPTETSYWGVPDDSGNGVATAFNASEAAALGNVPYQSGSVTCTAAEYGVAHALTDNVGEDSAIDGAELMNLFQTRMLSVLRLAMDDDYVALYIGLSQTVGVTNTTMTIPQAISAQQGLRVRGVNADALAYVLDNSQGRDMESALMTTSTSMAQFALSADRVIDYTRAPNNGMNGTRQIATLRGIPVVTTGLTDTANVGVDCVGACICPSTKNNDATGATTHGMIWKRLPQFETQRFAKARSTDLVMTARAGFAELQDGAGTAIITKN